MHVSKLRKKQSLWCRNCKNNKDTYNNNNNNNKSDLLMKRVHRNCKRLLLRTKDSEMNSLISRKHSMNQVRIIKLFSSQETVRFEKREWFLMKTRDRKKRWIVPLKVRKKRYLTLRNKWKINKSLTEKWKRPENLWNPKSMLFRNRIKNLKKEIDSSFQLKLLVIYFTYVCFNNEIIK